MVLISSVRVLGLEEDLFIFSEQIFLLDIFEKTSYDQNRSNQIMRLYSKLIQILSPFVYFFTGPALAFAEVKVNPCPESGVFAKLCTITGENFGRSVSNLVIAAIVLSSLVALAFLIYGGVKWIMSEGEKTAIENARQTIVGAVIGLVVIFLSYFILSIILGIFGIKFSELTIPTITP